MEETNPSATSVAIFVKEVATGDPIVNSDIPNATGCFVTYSWVVADPKEVTLGSVINYWNNVVLAPVPITATGLHSTSVTVGNLVQHQFWQFSYFATQLSNGTLFLRVDK